VGALTERARFPRAAVTLEAVRVAEVFRATANELEEIAGAAPAFELGSLRRRVGGAVLNHARARTAAPTSALRTSLVAANERRRIQNLDNLASRAGTFESRSELDCTLHRSQHANLPSPRRHHRSPWLLPRDR